MTLIENGLTLHFEDQWCIKEQEAPILPSGDFGRDSANYYLHLL
jgi:hypothetical protein